MPDAAPNDDELPELPAEPEPSPAPAVIGGAVWLAAALAVVLACQLGVPAYGKLYMEYGVALPLVTQLVFTVSLRVAELFFLIVPALILGTVVLVAVGWRRRGVGAVFAALTVLALSTLVAGRFALRLPMSDLEKARAEEALEPGGPGPEGPR